MKLSIIVTIYNAEKTLKRCLDSCLNQEIKNIEVVCINDGSDDDSQNIIDEYVRRYPRIFKSVQSKINNGIGSARNLGLENSSGEYFTFIDSDDYVEVNCYENILVRAVEENADIVIYDAYQVEESHLTYLAAIDFANEGEINKQEYFLSMPFAWNKIVKRSFYTRGFRFPERMWYSEYACVPMLGAMASKIIYIKHAYVMHDQANTVKRESKFRVKIMDIVKAITILNQNSDHQAFSLEIEYLAYQHILKNTAEVLNYYRQDQYLDEIANYMGKYFPRWQSNLYVQKEPKHEVKRANYFYEKKYKRIRWNDRMIHLLAHKK